MSIELRKKADRRMTPTKPLSRYSFRGRRKKARRANEDKNYYVDRYGSHYFIVIASILILCIMDAYFTLKILQFGGKELNPIMLIFFTEEPIFSMVFKYLITAGSIIYILIHKNFMVFGKVRGYYFLYAVFFVYFFLVMYEAYVFFTHITV